MKVLVCGSRQFTDYRKAKDALDRVHQGCYISEIIHGGAFGGDQCGARYAQENDIPVHVFPPDWISFGRRAGIVRNVQMLREGTPDYVVAFWDGKSKGTKHMIRIADEAGVPVKIVDICNNDE